MDRETEKANLGAEVGIPGSQSSYERHRLGNPVTMGSFERAASQYSQYPWLSETQETVRSTGQAQSILLRERDRLLEMRDTDSNRDVVRTCDILLSVIDVFILQVGRIDELEAQR